MSYDGSVLVGPDEGERFVSNTPEYRVPLPEKIRPPLTQSPMMDGGAIYHTPLRIRLYWWQQFAYRDGRSRRGWVFEREESA